MLPSDLTSLRNDSLMDLMVELTRWLEYVGVRLSRAEIEEKELALDMEGVEAKVLIASWNGGRDDRVAVSKAEVSVDERVVALREKHLYAHSYRKVMERLYDTTERKISTVSRELTRQMSMEPAQRRTHRHGGG